MLDISFKEKLEKEISVKAVRSSGKGGQNVNKVSTKIEIIYDVINSGLLTEVQKNVILRKNLTTQNGLIRVTSQKYRSQNMNKVDAVEKLFDLLKSSLKTKRKRIKTKPTATSKTERRKEKKQKSEIKKMRRTIPGED